MTHRHTLCVISLATLVVGLIATPTRATTIDFNTLGGANGDTFTTFTEDGFTVSATAGPWEVGKLFGNPVPDVFCDACDPGTLEVTGGVFAFDSVDFGNPISPALSFTITGFRSGLEVLSQAGLGPATGPAFATTSSVNPSQLLDELFISINTASGDGNVDNIVLTSSTVPEPATLTLTALGLAGVVSRRSRRRRAIR